MQGRTGGRAATLVKVVIPDPLLPAVAPRPLFAASMTAETTISVPRFSRPRSAHGPLEEVALLAFCFYALLSLFLPL